MDKKRTKEFLELVKGLQFTDIIGVGNILGVKERDDFEEYVMDILVAFNQRDRQVRKDIIELMKDVKRDNKVMISEREAKARDKEAEIPDKENS